MSTPPELLSYISQSRAAGLSDDAIRAELLKAGWQVTDVNEAVPARTPSFQPVIAPDTPPPAQFQGGPVSEAKPKRSHLGFYITLVLILLIGGATYLFLPQIVTYVDKLLGKTEPAVTPLSTTDDIVRPIGQPLDETANWQTYRNEEYGFEIKHPSNMVSEENPGGDDFIFLSLYVPSTTNEMTPDQDSPVLVISIANSQQKCATLSSGIIGGDIGASYTNRILGNNQFSYAEYEAGNLYGTYKRKLYLQQEIPCKIVDVSLPQLSTSEFDLLVDNIVSSLQNI